MSVPAQEFFAALSRHPKGGEILWDMAERLAPGHRADTLNWWAGFKLQLLRHKLPDPPMGAFNKIFGKVGDYAARRQAMMYYFEFSGKSETFYPKVDYWRIGIACVPHGVISNMRDRLQLSPVDIISAYEAMEDPVNRDFYARTMKRATSLLNFKLP